MDCLVPLDTLETRETLERSESPVLTDYLVPRESLASRATKDTRERLDVLELTDFSESLVARERLDRLDWSVCRVSRETAEISARRDLRVMLDPRVTLDLVVCPVWAVPQDSRETRERLDHTDSTETQEHLVHRDPWDHLD